MTQEPWDSLLVGDWAAVWDKLPDAPSLVPRPKVTQITLRLPAETLVRIKKVAAAKALPYHALVRSWMVDGLRESVAQGDISAQDGPFTTQLNIKVHQDLLDRLKARSNELRQPYHRLAREWIEGALSQEERNLGIDPQPASPPIKDLMVLLLHAPNKSDAVAVRGITRLQKLLFVIEQKLSMQGGGFYAFNYGPFNEEVNDAADALRLAGFFRGAEPVKAAPPSFGEMMAIVVERSGPRDQKEVQEFELNEHGHEVAERLRRSNQAYEQLFAYVRGLRQEWDTPDLLDRVYEAYPKYTERSLIREEVAERNRRRRLRR